LTPPPPPQLPAPVAHHATTTFFFPSLSRAQVAAGAAAAEELADALAELEAVRASGEEAWAEVRRVGVGIASCHLIS